MDRFAAFAILAVGVLLAGVGALAYRATMSGASYVQVSIMHYSFQPVNLTVRAGTTVRWINMDHVEHTITFGTHDAPSGIGSGLLGHMGGFAYTLTEPGIYPYHCDPHPYMTATIAVVP